MTRFDIAAPLPVGPTTTLLEASAGTGKTWTIGALVTRYVAEGSATLDEMLVVTFGRAASQELRARVREQLTAAALGLARPDDVTPGRDALVDLLLDAPADEVAARARRLRAALAGFDAATIATTHQFCHLVLAGLGVAGDTDRNARLVEDVDDLLVDVVDDLYVRGFARDPAAAPAFTRAQALAIARAVVGDPQARIRPLDAEPGTPAARRAGFAAAVRAEMSLRMRRAGLLSYDDLLSRLADALAPADAPARDRMRRRWRIVLVDEFQDTDPIQWQILDRAFTGHATMVLIGDPKQAIYAFRGGDVVTYLQAAATATHAATLSVNHRTDAPLLSALQAVLSGAHLGDPGIVVGQVAAAHAGSRLEGAPEPAPFRLRVATRAALGSRGRRPVRVGRARPIVAADVARDIRRLLRSDATLDSRPLLAGDVAVLAHTSRQLEAVRVALQDLKIPAVLAGSGSVYRTPAAAAWLDVLAAMEQPHRSPLVRAAALTPLLGCSAADLDAGGDALTDDVAGTLRGWADLLQSRGVAAVLEAATAAGLPARLLSRTGGERDLTDLRHVAQLLHEAALADRLGLPALLGYLRERSAEDAADTPAGRRRRLDSDAAAVQLSTIHGSKGLQYAVVHLPFLADRWVPDPDIPHHHAGDPAHGDALVRVVDVGGSHPGRRQAVRQALVEDAGESLRLLYVALTRAKSQVVAWWAPATNAEAAPLHRLLLGRTQGQGPVPDTVPVPTDEDAAAAFAAWQACGGPVVEAMGDVAEPDPLPEQPRPELSLRRFERTVDVTWRRTSYSALSSVETRGAAGGAAAVGSEPEEPARDDEPDTATPTAPAESAEAPDAGERGASRPSPMAALPVGTAFGSLVHAVLEETDPGAPDLRAELLARIDACLQRFPADLDRDDLADALARVLDTPLGPLAPATRLRDIGRNDRLCELEFELPLAGGDAPDADRHARTTLAQVAGLLRRHLPPGDPVLPYADRLDDPALGGQVLRGYLTGSIDVVLRVDDAFLVADYKTNWLGPLDSPLLLHAYAPVRLDAAMGHSDYPLQALLYAVVLHRYLRWRLPGYDPQTHLGGVLYLYLRGMAGADTPLVDGHPHGVFSWRPPAALVVELSDLLDGGLEAPGTPAPDGGGRR